MTPNTPHTAAEALTAIVRHGEALTPAMVRAATDYLNIGRKWRDLDQAVFSLLFSAGCDTDAARWDRIVEGVAEEMRAVHA